MTPIKKPEKKASKRRTTTRQEDIIMLTELVENMKELHKWQSRLLNEISQKVKSLASSSKTVK